MTIEDLTVGYLEGHTLPVVHHFQPCYPDPCRPVTFSVAAAPMPSDCEFSFFDPNDASCQDILFDPDTSVSELFAILRQWVPQVQQNIEVIGNEILKRGCNVNDRDGLTDMTLLHYTCKSGAQGIGDAETAAKFASHLIDIGADVSLRSRWTNMNALHYAAYFDVPELIHLILKASKPRDVDATCSDFDFGTALHIAASNLCLGAVKALLENRANLAFRDDRGRVPADVVPDPVDMPLEMADAAAVAKEIKQILLDAMPLLCDLSQISLPNYDNVPGNVSLQSSGLKLGDRVLIAGKKVGTLRYCGPTRFATGQWAGIEMEEADGKNDGSVGGVQYFKCSPKHGLPPFKKNSTFIQSNDESMNSLSSKKAFYIRYSSFSSSSFSSSSSSSSFVETKPPLPSHCRLPWAAVVRPRSSTLKTGLQPPVLSSRGSLTSEQTEFQPGDRVLVVGQRLGTIRFYGKTSFAPGYWCGIELDKPHGKNEGSISGVQYFTCPPKHGVFAPPSRVQRVCGSLDSLSEIPASKLNHSFPGFKRSLSSTSTTASQKDVDRRHSYGRARKPALRRSWSSTSSTSTSDGGVKLHKGSQVLLTSSNEISIIRYIGPTDFAPGVWLGLELRSAKGKNDGSVGDKRYFHCKPNHGILVRPGRVTYRGINGSKLVDEIC
ncbi:CAP-Gly domain-containing linker protein 4 isoform X2 [Bufo gargarizans]|uniref:CAP-Gly domain-containing linker protein 4 isoform X2 n=1 Tax=Bufo gargarizans TaxID=30331 RepID=UPI001CF2FB04|nr:CAP-Gly domain-containing linker protein 4 isoform X2 [Bufo gargarizans]